MRSPSLCGTRRNAGDGRTQTPAPSLSQRTPFVTVRASPTLSPGGRLRSRNLGQTGSSSPWQRWSTAHWAMAKAPFPSGTARGCPGLPGGTATCSRGERDLESPPGKLQGPRVSSEARSAAAPRRGRRRPAAPAGPPRARGPNANPASTFHLPTARERSLPFQAARFVTTRSGNLGPRRRAAVGVSLKE